MIDVSLRRARDRRDLPRAPLAAMPCCKNAPPLRRPNRRRDPSAPAQFRPRVREGVNRQAGLDSQLRVHPVGRGQYRRPRPAVSRLALQGFPRNRACGQKIVPHLPHQTIARAGQGDHLPHALPAVVLRVNERGAYPLALLRISRATGGTAPDHDGQPIASRNASNGASCGRQAVHASASRRSGSDAHSQTAAMSTTASR